MKKVTKINHTTAKFEYKCFNPKCGGGAKVRGRACITSYSSPLEEDVDKWIEKQKLRKKPWCIRCSNKLARKKKRDCISATIEIVCSLCGKDIPIEKKGVEFGIKNVIDWNTNQYKCAKGCK